jgi:predicted small lipoprotein YifL/YHS domain-containing protein
MRITMRNLLIIAALCSFAACVNNKGSESPDNAPPAAETTTNNTGSESPDNAPPAAETTTNNKVSESADNASPAAETTMLFLGNTTCTTSGHPAKPENFVEHGGQRAYFCCSKCVASAEADPAAAVAKAYAKPTAVGNTVCPVSGKAVNSDDSVTWQGHEVALCCGRCKKTFSSDRAGYTKTAIEGK